MLTGATAPLGLLLAAPVAEMVGVQAWYVTGGLVCLSMGVAGFFLPSLMRIEESPEGVVGGARQSSWQAIEPTETSARSVGRA
jgi:hypothetical protein